MDYETAILKLRGKINSGIKLGLQNITNLMEKLGNPQEKLKVIHIAGTNGKGSCSAFLNSVLISQGYKVGLFTSPSVYNFEERIRINNQNIKEDVLVDLMKKIRKVAQELETFPSDFELITAIAFLYFYIEKCDFVILEVGLGGRLDATNIIKNPLITLITSISFDHQQFLGNTLEEIAFEKAGILKENTDLILYSQSKKVMNAILKIAKEKNVKVFQNDLEKIEVLKNNTFGEIINYKNYNNLKINLLGNHQIKNATVCIEAIYDLRKKGIKISDKSVYEGFKNVKWPCRFEIIRRNPDFILDGAHNVDGIDKFVKNIEFYYPKNKKVAIFGVLSDKDYDGMLKKIIPIFDIFLTVTPDSNRAMKSDELKEKIKALTNCPVFSFEDYNDAIKKSLEITKKDDIIATFGSLYFVGEIRKLMGVEDF